MGLFELYRLDLPETVIQTIEARTSEEALELAGNRLAPLFGGAVQVSVPLLTMAAPIGLLGVRLGASILREGRTNGDR